MHLSKPLGLWLTPALVVAIGVLLLAFNPFGWEASLAGRLFDAWQRHLPLAARHVVALDLPALDEDAMARVAGELRETGARALVLTTAPVPEPSPQRLILKLPTDKDANSDAARAALSKLPEPGAALVAAANGMDLLVPAELGRPGRAPAARAKFVYRGAQNPFARVPSFATASGAPDVLEAGASGIGASNLIAGGDGVVRKVPTAFHVEGRLLPSLAVETLRVLEKSPAITVSTDGRDPLTYLRGVGIGALDTQGRALPTDPDGALWLRWGPVPHIAIADIAGHGLSGAVAVIGPPGDTVMTPLGPDTLAGATANAINTLMAGAVPARPAWIHLAEALGLALIGWGLVVLIGRNIGWAAGMILLVLPALFYGAWLAFARAGLLIDALTPAITLVVALMLGALVWLNEQRMIRATLRLAFADSLPRATIEKIARRPALLTVDGETRTVTYLVCGVRGLAELASRYREDAAAFTQIMQKVLSPLIDQALAHGGTVDRLTADGFAAFWNAPLDDDQHAQHACEAAAGMSIMSSRVTEQIALEADKSGIIPPPIEIGVGLATGQVIAGGFGGYGRMGYSVNGDAVVMAQRIQAHSHQYGPSVIAAAQTREAADRGFAWLEVDTIAAGVTGAPVTLYAVAGNPVMRASPKFQALTVFHDHIFAAIRKQQWARARALIAQCRRLSGASDKLYDLHLSRIAWYEKHPPGPDWDGAFRPVLE
ncbi:MAG: CHASE2 domain-containing protein [Alphaproteobacteria bacterium]|nr:CHASE2 domain-containing protein [Alphaproteobacteria bacterium]